MAAISGSAIWAAGLMKLGTIVTAIANWPIGIMIAGVLAFKADLGLVGLWTGPTIAWIVIVVSFNITVYLIDWSKLIKEAAKQREKDA
jgi:Na+-driven multidrug efflux pump